MDLFRRLPLSNDAVNLHYSNCEDKSACGLFDTTAQNRPVCFIFTRNRLPALLLKKTFGVFTAYAYSLCKVSIATQSAADTRPGFHP